MIRAAPTARPVKLLVTFNAHFNNAVYMTKEYIGRVRLKVLREDGTYQRRHGGSSDSEDHRDGDRDDRCKRAREEGGGDAGNGGGSYEDGEEEDIGGPDVGHVGAGSAGAVGVAEHVWLDLRSRYRDIKFTALDEPSARQLYVELQAVPAGSLSATRHAQAELMVRNLHTALAQS